MSGSSSQAPIPIQGHHWRAEKCTPSGQLLEQKYLSKFSGLDPTPKETSPLEAVTTALTHINGDVEATTPSEPAPEESSSPPVDTDSEDKAKA